MATLPMADEFYKADKHGHHFQKRCVPQGMLRAR